jgi:hypothetical protein
VPDRLYLCSWRQRGRCPAARPAEMLHALLHVFLVAWGPPLLSRPGCLLVSMLVMIGQLLKLWVTTTGEV